MRKLQLTIVAALAIHSAAHAQTGPTAAESAFEGRFIEPAAGSESAGEALRDANRCAPDVATPVWSRNGRVLGYSCNAPSAN